MARDGNRSWPTLHALITIGVLLVCLCPGLTPSLAHEDHYHLKDDERFPPIDDADFAAAVELIYAGDAEGLKRHLAAHPALVKQTAAGAGHKEYSRGYFKDPTLLHFAAFNPWWDPEVAMPEQIVAVTRVILEAGAAVDAESGEDPDWMWTTLGLVTSGNKPAEAGVQAAMIGLLIEHGADPNGGVLGAVAHERWDAFAVLLKHDLERTPMVLAALDEPDALRQALEGIEKKELQGALFTAVVKGKPKNAEVCLEAGADPNAFLPIHKTTTAMHQAAWYNQVEVLKVLIEHGGRFDIEDKTY